VGIETGSFAFALILELQDDGLRIKADFARIRAQIAAPEDTVGDLSEVLALDRFQQDRSDLRARGDLPNGQSCPHACLLKAFADIRHRATPPARA
jgi:hypothetical protein